MGINPKSRRSGAVSSAAADTSTTPESGIATSTGNDMDTTNQGMIPQISTIGQSTFADAEEILQLHQPRQILHKQIGLGIAMIGLAETQAVRTQVLANALASLEAVLLEPKKLASLPPGAQLMLYSQLSRNIETASRLVQSTSSIDWESLQLKYLQTKQSVGSSIPANAEGGASVEVAANELLLRVLGTPPRNVEIIEDAVLTPVEDVVEPETVDPFETPDSVLKEALASGQDIVKDSMETSEGSVYLMLDPVLDEYYLDTPMGEMSNLLSDCLGRFQAFKEAVLAGIKLDRALRIIVQRI